jgi:hypothetical protein
MADAFIQVPLDGPGKKVATSEVVNQGGATVERQQVIIADPTNGVAGGVAPVSTTSPTGTEAGLYVRVVSQPAGGATVDVTDRSARLLGHTTVDSLPSLPAGSAVIGHVIVDSAGSVSVTSLPSIPAGSNVIGHVIVDSGTIGISGTVDVSDRSARLVGHVAVDSLPSIPTGSNVIGHIIVDSGSIALSAAIPAGTNVIGHVIVDSVSGTVTVAGTVTANIGTTGGLALDSSLTTIDTDIKATQPRDVTDRSARLLGHVTVDNATLAVTLTSTTITGTVAVTQSTSPWTVQDAATVTTASNAKVKTSVYNEKEAQQLDQIILLLQDITILLLALKEPYASSKIHERSLQISIGRQPHIG